ncbi:hypothetical protein Ntsu_70330 [Nocardia sp. IFM 10818]
MSAHFDDKVVLITGGAGAIAGATAQAFADAGATVVLAGRTAEQLAEAAAKIHAPAGRIDWLTADVTDSAQAANMVAEVVRRHGGLHIAFNSAGVFGKAAPVADLDENAARGCPPMPRPKPR